MNTFTVNGKKYVAKKFDFNLVCDLEDMGVALEEMDKKPLSMVRAYFGICSGLDKASAGTEIEGHMKSGGKFEELTEAMGKEMNESDFFRSLSENQTKEATETPKKASTKK